MIILIIALWVASLVYYKRITKQALTLMQRQQNQLLISMDARIALSKEIKEFIKKHE